MFFIRNIYPWHSSADDKRSCNLISGLFERFVRVISCNSWAKLRAAEESFLKIIAQVHYDWFQPALCKQDWLATDGTKLEARSSKLDAEPRVVAQSHILSLVEQY